MKHEVYENRHPDGGIPERVVYVECDGCGKDITHNTQYSHDDEDYCEECALQNGFVECFACHEIRHEDDADQIDSFYFCYDCANLYMEDKRRNEYGV